jgi:hypothetical protein
MREGFAMLAPVFERWLVADQAIAEYESGLKLHHKFTTTRRLLKLWDYQLSTVDLRRLLARPSEDLLPTLSLGGHSFVIDCQRSEDGQVYARVAELDPPA